MVHYKRKFSSMLLVLLFILIPLKVFPQWSQVGTMGGQAVFSIVKAGGLMFAGSSASILTSGDIYVSSNGGNNWTLVNTGMSLSGIFALAYKDSAVYAGTYEDGLIRSTNGGLNWHTVNVNGVFGTGIFKLGISGQNIFAYANTGQAYYVSSNNGSNWSIAAGYTGGITNHLLDNVNSFYAATYKGLYLSTNNGFSWAQRVNTGLPVNPDGTKRLMSMLVKGTKIFASTNNPVNSVYSSTDEGNNWVQTTLVLPNNVYVKTMESSAAKIFAGVYGGSPQLGGVMMTMDEGSTWFAVNGGFPSNVNINALLRVNNELFACTQSHGIWKANIDQLTGVNSGSPQLPNGFILEQNYPNPFNPTTHFGFQISDPGFVSLIIYDVSGKELQRLVSRELQPGRYEADWNASDHPSGIYFYELSSGNFSITKKMILTK